MRAGALGDALLLRRAIYALKRGGCSVTLLSPAGDVLLGPGPAEADRLLRWEAPQTARLFADGPAEHPERGRFDAAVAYTRNAALALNLETLATRVESLDPEPPPGARHASEWLATPASALGFEAEAEPPSVAPTAEESEKARSLFASLPTGFLALHPGSGAAVKNWPVERFRDLARRLSPGRRWLLVSGPADEAATATLREEPGAVVAHDAPPRVLGALLSQAEAYVGNDSGVSHLAAAWGAPTVALFGPTDPRTWAPRGILVEALRAGTDTSSISIDAVSAAVGRMRAARSAAPERPSG